MYKIGFSAMVFAALLVSPALTKMLNSVKDGPYITCRASFGSRQEQAEALRIGKISFELAALEKNGAVLGYSCKMSDEFALYGVPDGMKLNPAIS